MSQRKNVPRKCVQLAVFLFLVAASALAAQAQVVFSPPKNISNPSGNTQAQQVAVDKKGNINLVWADNSLGNYATFFSRSSDAGATFSIPVSLSKHAQGTASSPQIALDSAGDINVVWTETDPSGQFHFVYFSRSVDGIAFKNPQNISGDAGAARGPRIVVESGGGIDLVWVDTSLGNPEIFFSRSTDGATFSTPLNISNDSGDSIAPQIAVDPAGNINVGWSDDTPGVRFDVFFSRSTDGGATFSAPLQVTKSNPYVHAQGLSQIAAGANGNIDLLWIQSSPFNGYALFSRSTDGGATFSAPSSPTGSFGFSFATSAGMALDPSGNDIGVVTRFFNTDSPPPDNVFVIFGGSADAGASFPNLAGIGEPPVQNAQLAVDAIGRSDVVYTFSGNEYGQTPCLCFAQSANGNEFSGATITSSAPSNPAVIALDASGNVYVVWIQSPSAGGTANVFFSRGAVPPFSLSISPNRVVEGSPSTGTLKLVTPAPAGGAVIFLSNSNPSAASVPASVTVPRGAASATFGITANPVSTFTPIAITASMNGSTNTVHLAVDPLFQILVFGNTTGGNTATGEISMSQPAPTGGLVISLSSSAPSIASVPASVTVPAGSRFAIFSIPTTPVTAPTTVQITGTGNGFTHTGAIAVQPARLQQFSVSPATAINTSGSAGTVTLTGPVAPGGGAVISLSSSDPSASLPASVTIPVGSTSASFTITTNQDRLPLQSTLRSRLRSAE